VDDGIGILIPLVGSRLLICVQILTGKRRSHPAEEKELAAVALLGLGWGQRLRNSPGQQQLLDKWTNGQANGEANWEEEENSSSSSDLGW